MYNAARNRIVLIYVGIIINNHNDIEAIADKYMPPTGKRVLCVGLS